MRDDAASMSASDPIEERVEREKPGQQHAACYEDAKANAPARISTLLQTAPSKDQRRKAEQRKYAGEHCRYPDQLPGLPAHVSALSMT